MTGPQFCITGMAIIVCVIVGMYEFALKRMEKRLQDAYRRP